MKLEYDISKLIKEIEKQYAEKKIFELHRVYKFSFL